MPILAAEPQVFPESLFEPNQEELSQRTWWALHTRPRQEKSLARQLYARRIPFYLPLVPKRLLKSNRAQITSHLPLFAGYCFLLAAPDERLAALGTNRIVRPIPVADQNDLWRDLTQIYRLIQSGASITAEDQLVPGKLVEITSGPLTGLRGKILERASQRRFMVEVDFIHKGASILVEDFTLAPVTN